MLPSLYVSGGGLVELHRGLKSAFRDRIDHSILKIKQELDKIRTGPAQHPPGWGPTRPPPPGTIIESYGGVFTYALSSARSSKVLFLNNSDVEMHDFWWDVGPETVLTVVEAGRAPKKIYGQGQWKNTKRGRRKLPLNLRKYRARWEIEEPSGAFSPIPNRRVQNVIEEEFFSGMGHLELKFRYDCDFNHCHRRRPVGAEFYVSRDACTYNTA